MKKKIVTLLAFVLLAIATTFANGNDISKEARAAFAVSFAKATDVKWEKENTYCKAFFTMNGQSLSALFDEEGKLIALSRNILSTDLPLNLQAALARNFSGYWITDLAEYAVGSETLYYLTVENADQKTVYESVGTYDWSLLKKTAK